MVWMELSFDEQSPSLYVLGDAEWWQQKSNWPTQIFLNYFFFLFGIAMNVAGLWSTRCIIQYVWQLGWIARPSYSRSFCYNLAGIRLCKQETAERSPFPGLGGLLGRSAIHQHDPISPRSLSWDAPESSADLHISATRDWNPDNPSIVTDNCHI